MEELAYNNLKAKVKDAFSLRVALVQSALEKGVKPTARVYQTSPQTVRFWLKRYKSEGISGLQERSHIPQKPHPQSLPAEIINIILALRKADSSLSQAAIAQKLSKQGFSVSAKTVRKHLQNYGLVKTHKAKNQGTKKRFPFEEIHLDIFDLGVSLGQMQTHSLELLPRYEFVLRDLATGATFLAYSKTLNSQHIYCFTHQVLEHLQAFKLTPKVLHAFKGSFWIDLKLDIGLIDLLHSYHIRPNLVSRQAQATWSAEHFHQIILVNLYRDQTFFGEYDLLEQAYSFERMFNFEGLLKQRKKTPFELASAKLEYSPEALLDFRPFCLDHCACETLPTQ